MASTLAAPPADLTNERVASARLLALGLQHVLVMYAGTVAVPLIVGGALHLPKEQLAFLINADLFAAGLATPGSARRARRCCRRRPRSGRGAGVLRAVQRVAQRDQRARGRRRRPPGHAGARRPSHDSPQACAGAGAGCPGRSGLRMTSPRTTANRHDQQKLSA
ncbi:protein of unknown function [Ralstonia solanacearum CFBP2957]|nr:protein of unknown function [Ralstonia solanacearum CFBP2957]